MREDAQASLNDTGLTLSEANLKHAKIDACRHVHTSLELSLADKKAFCERLERYHKKLLSKLATFFTQ